MLPRTSRLARRLGGPRSVPTRAPAVEAKASAAGPLVSMQIARDAGLDAARLQTPSPARASCRTPIVYRCVRMIADAAASVPLLLYDGDTEIEQHPLLDLVSAAQAVADAAPICSRPGTAICSSPATPTSKRVSVGGRVRELHALRPDRMKVVPGGDGWPEAYEYTVGRSARSAIARTPPPACAPILH